MAVEFHDHSFRQVAESGRGADSGRQHDAAAGRQIRRLHNRYVYRTQETIACHLWH